MSNNNEVSISVKQVQEIINEMKEISTLCSTPHLKAKVDRVQKFISDLLESSVKAPAQDIIYEEMIKAKQKNPELHLKLYMLYRNLTNGRISETDAMASFESYLSMFPSDIIVF